MATKDVGNLLHNMVSNGAIPPFVYTYPTRSSYRRLDPGWKLEHMWKQDEENSLTNELNLYIHVPFCRYKCGYCNLYTIISKDKDIYDAYTDALCEQLDAMRSIIERRSLRTIYIGGGTPTLLSRKNFATLFKKIDEIYPNWRSVTDEVAIEASPDSITETSDLNLVEYLMSLGITRINLGVESLNSVELKEAGRKQAGETAIREAIGKIKNHQLPNLSTDLIMGFANQSSETWEESVKELVKLRPETISTYFLTIRPDAWFSQTGYYRYQRDPGLYNRYDFARNAMLDAGYIQESNVRYKIQGRGGYRQKVLQFHGVPVLGIGAGARTYTNTADYLIGGSSTPTVAQIVEYIKNAKQSSQLVAGGYEFTDEERIRKRLALDLFDLDLSELEGYNLDKYKWIFEDIFEACIAQSLLVRVGSSRYQLTSKGYKYRDIISWMFFSDKVIQLDREFYSGLHKTSRQSGSQLGDPSVIGWE